MHTELGQNRHLRSGDTLDVALATHATEQAAIAASHLIGKGQEKLADEVAVSAMRSALNSLSIKGKIVIGEGERDKAPMLYIGEAVGTLTGPEVDIAVDPLEGTTICAHGAPNSLSVIAMSYKGGLLNAPDVYMDKIATGYAGTEQVINIEDSPKNNLKNLALAKKCQISDLNVVILNRPRHHELIAAVREAGARIFLISDGDIAPVVMSAISNTKIDMYVGIGGAPEGVLAAAALSVLGGQMMGRLLFEDNEQIARAKTMGVEDPNKIYTLSEMVKSDVVFAATGVTNGNLLEGVEVLDSKIKTHTLCLNSKNKSISYLKTYHDLSMRTQS